MSEQPYDLLIRGGTVIDGTGSAPERADVAVRDGRIAAVGDARGPAVRVIEVRGLAVTPGFIDVHSHDDAAVIRNPSVDFKVMQGVTTDVVGNCGAGMAPAGGAFEMFFQAGVSNVLGPAPDISWRTFGEYMDAVEAARPALNVACLVPHGVIRFAEMGLESRPPERHELAAMREHVQEAMEAGAVGLSTGLIYPPGAFAKTPELVELAKAAAEAGGLYASHIRDEGSLLLDAVAEAIDIGRGAGLAVQVSHFKAAGRENWGSTKDSIRLVEQARAEGVDVAFDAYPYTAASTILWAVARETEAVGADEVMVASVRERREYEGKTIAQIAEMLDLPVADALSRLLQEERDAVAVFFAMDEGDVRRVLKHELCMIGSDGLPSEGGKPHPRLYGTFPRVLAHYARQEGLLTLEEAVHKMTGLPARRFGLEGRGELKEGWCADIVVFDPQAVTDTATYEDPRKYPRGIECVVVNGQVVAEKGKQTSARPGRLLRRGQGSPHVEGEG
jgi:N-acyl-D-amino-acid deacylase